MSDIESRKQDHVDLSLDPSSQYDTRPFEAYRLPYKALPEINLEDVSTETELFGKKLSQPLIISSMTGGTKYAGIINKNLAIAAEAARVALGVGSQRIALEKREAIESFELVRKHAPTAVLFANMGAIQLNNGRDVADYEAVVRMIAADALYLHINPLQEAIQPGGDTNYAGLLKKIEQLVAKLSVPVFVKEVGHGIDEATAKALFDIGVAGVDVAGLGGTSYAWIEARRAGEDYYADWFRNVGVPTDEAVVGAARHKGERIVVASGGIRNPLAAVKARALGADYVASARSFLKRAVVSADETIAAIEMAHRGIQITLFSCGVSNWQEAANIELIHTAETNYSDNPRI